MSQKDNKIEISFEYGPKVEIIGSKPKSYHVKFINGFNNEVVHSDIIKQGMWTKAHIEYYIPWIIEIDGEVAHKFDVKGMKKKNRWDNNFQDDIAWVEGTNVRGEPGWVKGKADYIVFERNKYWLVVDRQELFDHVVNKLQEKGYEKGKGIYQVYQREGRLDKITMVPYEDIEKLTNIEKVNKDK